MVDISQYGLYGEDHNSAKSVAKFTEFIKTRYPKDGIEVIVFETWPIKIKDLLTLE